MKAPNTFRTLADLEAIEPPIDRPAIYVRHEVETWFGVCIMRPKKKNGAVTRQYFVRLGDERKRFANVADISYSDARKKALQLYSEYRDFGKPAAYTLRQLWLAVKREKMCLNAWREATLENYERFVPPDDLRNLSDLKRLNLDQLKQSQLHILPLWFLKIGQITPEKLQSVLDDVLEGVRKRTKGKTSGRATVAALVRWLNMMFVYAQREGWLRTNPVGPLINRGYAQASEPRAIALKADDIPNFWNWLHTKAHPAARDFILIALFMGLRRSVIANLRWEQIDLKRRTMLVQPNARGNKAGKLVAFPIPDYLLEKVFLPRWNAPDRHPVWVIESPKRPGEPYRSVRSILTAANRNPKGTPFSLRERTGIHLTPHAFRRTGATWLFTANNGDLLITQRFLSHKLHSSLARSAVSTGYIVTEIERMREAMNRAVDFAIAAASGGLTDDARAAYDEARTIEGVGFDIREDRGGSEKAED